MSILGLLGACTSLETYLVVEYVYIHMFYDRNCASPRIIVS